MSYFEHVEKHPFEHLLARILGSISGYFATGAFIDFLGG